MNDQTSPGFTSEVLEASKDVPVVVDFWAEWCGPCKVLGPILERLEKQDGGQWKLVKVDTDRNQSLAATYGIRGIPHVKLFVDGKVVDEFTGAQPERVVRQWLDSNLPDPFKVELESADRLLGLGNRDEAIAVLGGILRQKPDHADARVLLAKSVLYDDPDRAVSLVAGIDDPRHYLPGEAIRTIGDMMTRAGKVHHLAEGPAKATYSTALDALAARRFDDAIEGFIEVIRKDRAYDGDSARKVCVALFTLLGDDHPTTLKYRRTFAGALNR